jgi:lipopolysaccharide transport system ATP-binding protein
MNSEPATRHQSPATHSEEVLVRVEGVSKKFCRSLKKSLWYGVCDIAGELSPFGRRPRVASSGLLVAGNGSKQDSSELATSNSPHATPHGLRPDEFYAVRDVSFELRRGECLGLIGHNGAGKTTLLKMLNGLIKPDSGKITMRGRVGALIALGAGFNPILTGRENIYINGSVLGLSKKEIDEKIEEIIDFAEIGEFIDSPVQNYSSGMTVRLGFAVATALNPDVLILDEVLAVGDAKFRNKCYNKIGKMHARAATIFVSHSMDQVAQVCDKVLVMHHGQPVQCGGLGEGIALYESLNSSKGDSEAISFETIQWPIECASIDVSPSTIQSGEKCLFQLDVTAKEAVPSACLRIAIYDEMGVPFAEWNSFRLGHSFSIPCGASCLEVLLGPIMFKKATYALGVVLTDNTGVNTLMWSFKKYKLHVDAETTVGPNVALSSPIQVQKKP